MSTMPAMPGWRPRQVELPRGPLWVYECDDVDGALSAAILAGAEAPYGRVLWDAATAVAHAMESQPDAHVRWRDKAVVELACGVGLPSLVCARLGAAVTATDIDDAALYACVAAADAQGMVVRGAVFDLMGNDALPAADVLIVTDVLYDDSLTEAVCRRIEEAWRRGLELVVGCPGRGGTKRLMATIERLSGTMPVFHRQVWSSRNMLRSTPCR
jgi:predicted nicotinamide N-methyase